MSRLSVVDFRGGGHKGHTRWKRDLSTVILLGESLSETGGVTQLNEGSNVTFSRQSSKGENLHHQEHLHDQFDLALQTKGGKVCTLLRTLEIESHSPSPIEPDLPTNHV